MKLKKILIADDDAAIRFAFSKTFESENIAVLEASNGREAITLMRNDNPQAAFLDYSMPEMDGFDVMEAMHKEGIDIPIIIITGFGTMETAIRAVQLGAYEYITKPLDIDKVRILARRALEVFQLKERVKGLEFTIQSFPTQHSLIGNHPRMQEIYKTIGAITGTPNSTTVLITGESGTGKELVARAIHNKGHYSSQPFIAVNCSILPEMLIESELFGHEKGAFTGAVERRIGKFEIAKSGTIFLDEIGDLPQHLQQKLLRVLQERCFERLGGNNLIPVEARIIAATNHHLLQDVKENRFREDLFYRLNVVSIHTIPMRERKADIPLLINLFMGRAAQKMGKTIVNLDHEALSILEQYDYPGNVRELENIIEKAVLIEKSSVLTSFSLPQEIRNPSDYSAYSFPIKSYVWREARRVVLRHCEHQFLIQLLNKTKGNVTQAAQLAKIERQSFQRMMKKYNLFSADFKE